MAQQGNLGFDPACPAKPGEPLCTHHPVARDNEWDRIATTGSPHRLCRYIEIAGNLSISACIAERNRENRGADLALEIAAPEAQW